MDITTIGLAVQAPWGALIDAVRCKRALIVTDLTVLALGAMAVAWWPSFAVVMTAKTLMAVAGTGFGPAVAAMTLGLCPPHPLARRLGWNAAWDHAGNVTIDRSWLVTVQCLDGVRNGLCGALMPLVLYDLMRGTRCYNVASGAAATLQGIGTALSHGVAGCSVVTAG